MKQLSPVTVVLLVVASAGITDGFIFPRRLTFPPGFSFRPFTRPSTPAPTPKPTPAPTPRPPPPPQPRPVCFSTCWTRCSFVLTYVFGRGWTRRFRCIPLCGLRCLRGKRSTTDKGMVYILY